MTEAEKIEFRSAFITLQDVVMGAISQRPHHHKEILDAWKVIGRHACADVGMLPIITEVRDGLT